MQTWNAALYGTNAAFVAELGQDVLALLRSAPGARVLDLGCGDGVLTQELVRRGYRVTGVDASEDMVAAARARGLDAHVADGHALTYRSEYDAVFSNAALHWLTRPDDCIASMRRALRPGGELVAELGGEGNTATLHDALLRGLAERGIEAKSPWYFPSPADYATRLERAGFRVTFLAHFDRPTPLPGDLLAWVETFGGSFTRLLPASERAAFLAELRARVAPALYREGRWTLDYVRLRVRAVLRA